MTAAQVTRDRRDKTPHGTFQVGLGVTQRSVHRLCGAIDDKQETAKTGRGKAALKAGGTDASYFVLISPAPSPAGPASVRLDTGHTGGTYLRGTGVERKLHAIE